MEACFRPASSRCARAQPVQCAAPQRLAPPSPHRPAFISATVSPSGRRHACPRRGVAASAAGGPPPSSLAETAALDELIDILLAASDATDLTPQVAENMLSFDQRFWLRLATRTDTAADEAQRERLTSLARVVMQLVDAMVRKTNEQLSDSAGVLQEILRAAADERTGEWTLPLTAEKVAAMRQAMDERADKVDEALLSNCFAWMRKSSDDKMDGMVTILQKVLQVYASRALSAGTGGGGGGDAGAADDPASAVLAELLAQDEDAWAGTLRRQAEAGAVSEVSFLEALQRRMESVVLGLSSGSYAQRVQAEYLKELESRAKEVFVDIAAGR